MTWLREPITITRRNALVIAAIIGLSISASILIGANTVANLRRERERAISTETLTKGEIVRIVHRVANLERPSELELDARIRIELKRCLRSPRCLDLFLRVRRRADSKGITLVPRQSSTPAADGGGSGPERPGSRAPGSRPPTSPTRPGGPPQRTPPGSTPPPAPPDHPAPAPLIPIPLPGLPPLPPLPSLPQLPPPG